jgi:hypothetical protein
MVIDDGIPFKSDAFEIWDYRESEIITNGSNKYFKGQNGHNLLITGFDFDAGWGKGFLYKSAATVSAPAGDTAFIATDVNHFFYDISGTPNQIPVISLFQNVDYAGKLFSRHYTQTVDPNGVETYEARVWQTVLYNNVKTGVDLVKCNPYFKVPAKLTTGFREVGAGTYSSLKTAITAASPGETIYLYTQNLVDDLSSINKSVTIKGLGLVNLSTTAGQTYMANLNQANITIEGIIFNNNNNQYGITTGGYENINLKRCVLNKSNSDATHLMWANSRLIENCIIKGDIFYYLCALTVKNCFLTTYSITSASGTALASSVSYCRFKDDYVASSTRFLVTNRCTKLTFEYNDINLYNLSSVVSSSINSEVLIRYNKAKLNRSFGASYGFFRGDVSMMEGNKVEFTGGGGYSLNMTQAYSHNSTIRNNIFINHTDSNTQYVTYDSSSQIDIYNNTFITKNVTSDGVMVNMFGVGSTTINPGTINCYNNNFLNPRHFDPNAQGGHCCLMSWNTPKANIYNNNFDGGTLADLILKGLLNQTNGMDMSASSVHHNIINQSGLLLKGLSNLKVYNNLIKCRAVNKNALYCVHSDYDTSDTGNKIVNNIIVSEDTYPIVYVDNSYTDLYLRGNVYYSPNGFKLQYISAVYDDLQVWLSQGYDANSIASNPNLTSGLWPSVPINIGENLGATYENGLDISINWGNENNIPSVVTKKQTGTWQVGPHVQQ